jgi:hypothetical protein
VGIHHQDECPFFIPTPIHPHTKNFDVVVWDIGVGIYFPAI